MVRAEAGAHLNNRGNGFNPDAFGRFREDYFGQVACKPEGAGVDESIPLKAKAVPPYTPDQTERIEHVCRQLTTSGGISISKESNKSKNQKNQRNQTVGTKMLCNDRS